MNVDKSLTPNFEPRLTAYLHAKSRALGIPLSGTFELTSRCNFNCKMCYIHGSDSAKCKGRELSAEEWLNIAQDAKKEGTLFLLLTGGEPLIREDFPYIYEELAKMGFVMQLNTNASLIKGANEEVLLKYPPSRMNVSLYGATSEAYLRLCGTDARDAVINNIKRMKGSGTDVWINNCLLPENSDEREAMNEIAKELNLSVRTAAYVYPRARRIDIAPDAPDGRFTPERAAEEKFSYEKLRYPHETYIKRLNDIVTGVETSDRECVDNAEPTPGVQCRAGSSAFWINWEGKMSMCGMIADDRYPVRELGFRKAWDGVRQSTEEIRLPQKCVGCRFRSFCNICAAVAKTETGRFDCAPEYVCRYSECIMEKAKKLLEEENSK